MKCYRSFLVRCWLIEDSQQGQKKIIDVEHIQTGDHTRVAAMTEAEEWMFAVGREGRNEPPAVKNGTDTDQETR